MKLREYLKADLARRAQPSFRNFLKTYFSPHTEVFRYIVWLRIVQYSKTSRLKKYAIGIPAYWILHHFEYKYGIHCNTNIPIGKGFCVVHGGAVYLNCQSIGENVTIHQGVTLGENYGHPGQPILEDGVAVFANAVVVGGITLHRNCMVGANSFVSKDIPADSVAAGVPAKVIREQKNTVSPR